MKKVLEYKYATNKIFCWQCKKKVECYESHIVDTHSKRCPFCDTILDFSVDASISIDQIEE